jgi:hypothetical protein
VIVVIERARLVRDSARDGGGQARDAEAWRAQRPARVANWRLYLDHHRRAAQSFTVSPKSIERARLVRGSGTDKLIDAVEQDMHPQ